MTVTPYPLQWPANRPRTPVASRRNGKFMRRGKWLTIADALSRLQHELDRLGAELPVVSTNVKVRLDGLPRSDQGHPEDPGIAIYFQLDGDPICMPCDTYTWVADNIAAVAAHIEATRAIERYGVVSLKEMFSGFAAISAQPGQRAWWAVLGIKAEATPSQINEAYRRLARERHPDQGGSDDAMAELNMARDQALRSDADAR